MRLTKAMFYVDIAAQLTVCVVYVGHNKHRRNRSLVICEESSFPHQTNATVACQQPRAHLHTCHRGI